MHLPVVVTFAGLFVPFLWPAVVKAACVFTATAGVCLLSYAVFVRGSFVSVLLNGRRYPPGFQYPDVDLPPSSEQRVRSAPPPPW